MNPDFIDLLRALLAAEARFLVVGAHAVTVHGSPRTTGDLDLWLEPSADNATRVWSALAAYGAPMDRISLAALSDPDMVTQIGVPPRRVDLLTSLTGLEFERCWTRRVNVSFEGLACPFLGRDDLVRNKRATGRPRDLADLEALGEA